MFTDCYFFSTLVCSIIAHIVDTHMTHQGVECLYWTTQYHPQDFIPSPNQTLHEVATLVTTPSTTPPPPPTITTRTAAIIPTSLMLLWKRKPLLSDLV